MYNPMTVSHLEHVCMMISCCMMLMLFMVVHNPMPFLCALEHVGLKILSYFWAGCELKI